MAKTFLTHAEYCRNKEARKNSPRIYSDDGNPYIFWKGRAYTYPEFDKEFPVELPIVDYRSARHWKGENPNKKTEAMRQ